LRDWEKRESEFRYNDDEGGRELGFSVGVQEGKGRTGSIDASKPQE